LILQFVLFTQELGQLTILFLGLKLHYDTSYFFANEIQRKENAVLFLKGLIKMSLPYKWFISSSGSVKT